MILIDANIFMYAVGAAHPYKAPSVAYLRQVATGQIEAATDAEVLQEILHRYRSIRRWDDGNRVFELARRVTPLVLPITDEVVDRARSLMSADARLGARDAIHAAVAVLDRCEAICSYDRDFDRVPRLARVVPPEAG